MDGYAPLLKGQITGFVPTHDSGDTDHDVNIGVGVCRDDANTENFEHEADITKQIDATFVQGDDAGGMAPTTTETGTYSTTGTTVDGTASLFNTEFQVGDVLFSSTEAEGRRITQISSAILMTIESAFDMDVASDNVEKNGLAPNASYHIHLIEQDSDGDLDFFFDTSPVGANPPSGWTWRRRVIPIRTDVSDNIINGSWRELAGGALRNDLLADVHDLVDNTTTGRQTLALTLPLGISLLAILKVRGGETGAGLVFGWVRSVDFTDVAPAVAANDVVFNASGDGTTMGVTEVPTDTSATIAHRQDSAQPTLNIITSGYIDDRRV